MIEKMIDYMSALCNVWRDAVKCENMLLKLEPSFSIPPEWGSYLHTLNISCIMKDLTDTDAVEIASDIARAFENGIIGKLVKTLVIQLKGYEALNAPRSNF